MSFSKFLERIGKFFFEEEEEPELEREPYDVDDIVDYIIMKVVEEETSVDVLKLQAYLYFLQAQFLVALDRPCFKEKIVAYSFSPVVPEIYNKYSRKFGFCAIFRSLGGDHNKISDDDKSQIDGIIEQVNQYTKTTLQKLMMAQSPWNQAMDGKYERGCSGDPIIQNAWIKEYFADSIKEYEVKPEDTEMEKFKKSVEKIKTCYKKLPDGKFKKSLDQVFSRLDDFIKLAEEDNNRLKKASKLSSYYLPTMEKLIKKYLKMVALETNFSNVNEIKREIEKMPEKMLPLIADIINKSLEVDTMDVKAELSVFDQMTKMDTQDELPTVNPVKKSKESDLGCEYFVEGKNFKEMHLY